MKQQFMQKAIELAYENVVNNKCRPFGSVVVKDGEIIGTGTNLVGITHDPSAHAEILALREAAQKLQRSDLSDCEIYACGEPCPMCLGAIYWANIKTVYYAYPKDPVGPELNAAYIYEQAALPVDKRDIKMELVPNAEPDKNPFVVWKQLVDAGEAK